MLSIIVDGLCHGNPCPPTVWAMLEMLNRRVILVFPAIEILVAEVARHVVRVEFSGVKVEAGFGELGNWLAVSIEGWGK